MKKSILIFLALCLIVGCSTQTPASIQNFTYTGDEILAPTFIGTIHDDEKSVTCWVYKANSTFGIGFSCLPDSMLNEKSR